MTLLDYSCLLYDTPEHVGMIHHISAADANEATKLVAPLVGPGTKYVGFQILHGGVIVVDKRLGYPK